MRYKPRKKDVPFLMRMGFKFIDEVKDGKLYVNMMPKKNIWFYLFAFIEAFKCICDLKCIEESEGKK